ncbi:hypothetical protein [Nocardioides sp. InS609-2]|uniref:hypothetical protein n=1 Tax=Nocardioides sp. InS609-2 TaxID=2760705 RepID=UPI0020C1495F|nr:hypothetical protein [Nocardioides sp. InS609-2]
MNDELPELSPAETERVRRLLAEARHTDPVPADVAARLDRTLATLAEERRELHSSTVVTLASRRRRRVTQLLVAAVAVVAVGIGVAQVVSGMDTDLGMSTADDSADSGAGEAAEAPDQESQPLSPSAESRGDTGGESAPDRNGAKSALSALPRVDDATFDADAADARARQGNTDATTAPDDDSPGTLFDGTCDRDAWGDGERVLVRYQGDRAALVFRPAPDGSQVVDLFACDGDDVLRSGIVAAP